jgi:hypothetical protein
MFQQALEAWFEWYQKPLPGTLQGVTPQNILEQTKDNNITINEHGRRLIPHLARGEDKHGHPVYWEKSGWISKNFGELKKHYAVDDLVVAHLRTNFLNETRAANLSVKHGKDIHSFLIVFDVKHVNMTPDLQAFEYLRR